MRATVLALVLAAVAVACTDRKIEESHRHLAAEWCRDMCTKVFECPAPQLAYSSIDECRAGCEGDEWWDWTDACGDRFWEFHECLGEMTCEGVEQNWNDHPNYPCLEEEHAAYWGDCTYDEDHGN